MADIFLSYSRADAERVAGLAGALEEHGWSVFWDTVVLPGQRWRDVIHRELSDAKCVIVVWSVNSSGSNWVVEEASEALAEGKLLPVMVDSAEPPFGFRSVEAADLRTWEPGVPNRGFDVLIDAMTSIIGSPDEETALEPAAGGGDVGGVGAEVPPEAASIPPVGGHIDEGTEGEVAHRAEGEADNEAEREEPTARPPTREAPRDPDANAVTLAGRTEPAPEDAITGAAADDTSGAAVASRSDTGPDERRGPEEAPVPALGHDLGEAFDERAVGGEAGGGDAKPEPASRSDRSAPPSRPPDARPGGPPEGFAPDRAMGPASDDAAAPPPAAAPRSEPATAPRPAALQPTRPSQQEPSQRIDRRWLIAAGGVVAALILVVVFSSRGDDDPGGGGTSPDVAGVTTEATAPAVDGNDVAVFDPEVVEFETVVAERVAGPMTIDASPDDWAGVTKAYVMRHFVRDTQEVGERLGVDSPGVVSVGYDDTALYLLAQVDDDVYSQPNEGNQIWRGDALDLNISTVPVDQTPERPDRSTFQVTMTPLSQVSGQPGHVVFSGRLNRFGADEIDLPILLSGTVAPDGLWTLEAAIPWSVIGLGGPPDNTPFSALFSVFDNDGEREADGDSQQTVILGHVPDAAFQTDVRTWGAFDIER